ncbi:methyl-accepting chemotaxis protein McpS [mine drainage metagenome]|uniref:Methyl-accepting chemotaxis protein McpS n=1 Tax=mine drainage metagenome TaxID=410659 RepID=A0A1J5TMB0_9ZZZZ
MNLRFGSFPLKFKFALYCLAALLIAELSFALLVQLLEVQSSWAILVTGMATALVAALIFYWLIACQLGRLREIADQLARLGKGDITARIAWPETGQTTALQDEATLQQRVDQLAKTFSAYFQGGFSLHPEAMQQVGKTQVPALKNEQTILNMNFSQVDRLFAETKGVATIFARRGEDFVRIATCLKMQNGTRVVGTMLDSTRPAYASLLKGQTFTGRARLFGTDYMTQYNPVKGRSGEVIGALFVGLEIERAAQPENEIAALAQGFNSVAEEFGSFVSAIVKAAEAVADASTELAANSARAALNSEQQSEAASSTAAAVEEVTVSITLVAERAQETENASSGASDLSEDAQRLVQDATGKIARIADSVNELSQAIITLKEHSTQIGGIVQVIREIADQTNLLALNAAIEAARAGEQGRGFAVVADEVRKLSERTGQATLRIADMIDSIKQEISAATQGMSASRGYVEEGVVQVKSVHDALNRIKDGSHQIGTMIREISAATREQSMASTGITHNVEKIAQMTEGNSAVIAEVSGAAAHLQHMSSTLQNMAHRFRL